MFKKFLAYCSLVITIMLLLPTTSMALSIGGYPTIYKGSLDILTLLKGIRNTQLAGSLLTLRILLNQWGGGRCINGGGQSLPANGVVFTPGLTIDTVQIGGVFETAGTGKYTSDVFISDEELLAAFREATAGMDLSALCPNSNWTFDDSNIFLAGFDVDATGFFCIDGTGKVTTCPESPATDVSVSAQDRVGARYSDPDGTLQLGSIYPSTLLCDGLNACKTYFGFAPPTTLSY